MAIGTKIPRLLAAAKEFNVGKDTILKFLEEQEFDVKGFKPNSKLTAEMYDALQEKYAQEKAAKRKSDSIDLPKGSVFDGMDKTPAELDVSSKNQSKTDTESNEITTDTAKEDNSPTDGVSTEEQPKKTTPDQPSEDKSENADKPEVIIQKDKPEKPEKSPTTKEDKREKTEEDASTNVIKNKPVSEEPKALDDSEATTGKASIEGPKVVTKIDLDAINQSTRPKKSTTKKSSTKKTTSKSKKSEKEPSPTKAKTEDIPSKTDTKQSESAVDDKPVVEPAPLEHIETKTPKLKGFQVVGKIKLPEKQESRGRSKEKRKRKRIPVSKAPGVHASADPSKRSNKSRNGDKNSRDRRRGRKNDVPQEIDQKEIQEKIKETQAKLAGGGAHNKSLKAKYRRNKREERAERRAAEQMVNDERVIQVTEFISVSELANLLDVSFTDVISKCMSLGIMVSINQRLDAEVIELVASEFDTEVEFINLEDNDQEEDDEIDEDEGATEPRAPIITIMGHVDHGKTSLLDYIRKTNVLAGEAGGITQHIGAYKVITAAGKELTFLDTPGHEAFTAMRARGAKAADVAIIVIAADDAIMPQTREAISHAQAADLPMVFAINKIDKEGANPDKIREQLSTMNILVEDWGGKYQCQEISAKKGTNIDELLEKILLEAELLELKADPDRDAVGTVIEASLDKGRGYVSTILVHTGTLHAGEMIVTGQYYGKIKAMTNERGQRVQSAGPSTPVQVLGLNGAPQAGEKFKVYEDESEAKSIANHRARILREQGLRSRKHITLDEIGRRLALGNFKELNVIIKADFDGSAEALSDALQKLSTEEIVVNVVLKGVGQISESDVMLASASDAIIIGFQVRPSVQSARLAEQENIEIRQYSIIYDAIAQIKSAMEGMLEPTVEKQVVGNMEVRETFKISKVGTIAGCYVTDGKFTRNTKINVIRDGVVVHSGELASLKRFKDDVKEVTAGYECGVSLKGYNDVLAGDVLEGYDEIQVKRTL